MWAVLPGDFVLSCILEDGSSFFVSLTLLDLPCCLTLDAPTSFLSVVLKGKDRTHSPQSIFLTKNSRSVRIIGMTMQRMVLAVSAYPTITNLVCLAYKNTTRCRRKCYNLKPLKFFLIEMPLCIFLYIFVRLTSLSSRSCCYTFLPHRNRMSGFNMDVEELE